jgi:hypothetical protein
MRIRVGYELNYEFHHSRVSERAGSDIARRAIVTGSSDDLVKIRHCDTALRACGARHASC